MTGDLPTLSVIISCRNSASTLAETLESIAMQRYPGWWEVVVVDNGSTDTTSDVAQAFSERLPHFSLLTVPDPGYQPRGINYGITHSKGEAIIFLDSDDLVAQDYLLHMGEALTTQPFVGGALEIELLNPEQVRRRRAPVQQDRIDEFCGYLPAVVGASMSARREPVEAVGGFDEALPTQHDLDISWRLKRAGYPASLVPEAVLHYRYRTGSRAIFDQEFGYGEGEVALYRKHREYGLRRRSLRQMVAGYVQLVTAIATVYRQGGTARLATVLGIHLGRLRGSLRFRTWYP
jgi:glycosyltransferase involved in cell wall biosynthesis